MMTEDISWPELCGDELFWDSQQFLNTSSPSVTQCFKKSVLETIPTLLFIVYLALYLPYMWSWPKVNGWRAKGRWQMFKLMNLSVMMIITLIDFVMNCDNNNTILMILTFVIKATTLLLAGYVCHAEFCRGFHTSGPLLLLWIAMFANGAVTVYMDFIVGCEHYQYITYTFYGLAFAQLCCMFFSDLHAHQYLEKEGGKNKSPEMEASVPSMILYTWIFGMVKKFYNRDVEFDDLYDVVDSDRASEVFSTFDKEWKRLSMGMTAKKGDETDYKPSLRYLQALIKTTGIHFWLCIFIKTLEFMTFVKPVLLSFLISWMASDDPYTWKGYSLAALLVLQSLFETVVCNLRCKINCYACNRTKTAIFTSVYKKSLKLSPAARQLHTTGEIVNLMSVDHGRLWGLFWWFHDMWSSPVELVLAVYMLYLQVGQAALFGVALIACAAHYNGKYVAKEYVNIDKRQMTEKDARSKMMTEILKGIKVLKMYAWESWFEQKVEEIRDRELGCIKDRAALDIKTNVTIGSVPYLVSLLVFGAYTLMGNSLGPATAFTAFHLIGIINGNCSYIPMMIPRFIEAITSLKRISNFLLEEELDKEAVNKLSRGDSAVNITHGGFSWQKGGKNTLNNINLNIPEGQLVAIVGSVGSGKTSLLSAILGEMNRNEGCVAVKGSVSYVPQQAWIQNLSLKDNILFGRRFKEPHYNKVLDVCALRTDLSILPGGDQTEIGEKGINLSGGQKQRVNLARAVYQNNDVYLLDDPLSAVDSHVGKHIFEQVIGPNGLLRNKTRVLVTHSVTYLKKMDFIITMKDGEVSEMGTYQDLLASDSDFAEFIQTYVNEKECVTSESSSDESEVLEDRPSFERQLSTLSDDGEKNVGGVKNIFDTNNNIRKRHKKKSTLDLDFDKTECTGSGSDMNDDVEDKIAGKLITDEEEEDVGNVNLEVMKSYFGSTSTRGIVLFTIFLIISVALDLCNREWVSNWTSDEKNMDDEETAFSQTLNRITVYGILGISQRVIDCALTWCLFTEGVKKARHIHTNLLTQVLRAPMSFFDTTPSGRIVNRFANDMNRIDTQFSGYINHIVRSVLNVIGKIALVVFISPTFLFVMIPLAMINHFVQRTYHSISKPMRKMHSTRTSPVYANFDETLSGATTIRAFNKMKPFIEKNDRLVDDQQRVFYCFMLLDRWNSILFDTIAAMLLFGVTIICLNNREHISGGEFGLALTIVIECFHNLGALLRCKSEIADRTIAYERILKYTNMETEAAQEIEDMKPSASWPQKGEVQFSTLSNRYRDGLDLVMKDVTFDVKAGEKIGIVGRTGAGKSTIALSLFRIIEAAKGKITIDGIDIADIGLHDLRSKLTVIPQDPVIFCGTIHQNLDPFNNHSEDELWHALELAHLKSYIVKQEKGLDYECGEGGENLSAGQRQLVCLARALLRKTKILILDEATASVDMETDDLIQETIRTAFEGHTVLTVAHRLNTIMDYDRILVLNKGEIQEFDTPTALLDDNSSEFYSMAKDANIVL